MALFDLTLQIVASFDLSLKHEMVGLYRDFDLSGTLTVFQLTVSNL